MLLALRARSPGVLFENPWPDDETESFLDTESLHIADSSQLLDEPAHYLVETEETTEHESLLLRTLSSNRSLVRTLSSNRSGSQSETHTQRKKKLSSFGQTLFNAINILMGVGLLSLPYAMRLSGWFGLCLLVALSLLTRWTAKLMGHIQEYVPAKKLRDGPDAYVITGLHDMADLALGRFGKPLFEVLFVMETFGYCCVFLIIEGENLYQQLGGYPLFKGWTRAHFRSLSALVFAPTCLVTDFSWLSYLSALGVSTSVLLLVGLTLTGLSSHPAPNPAFCSPPTCTGMLLNPSATDTIHLDKLMEVSGLMMVGFGGHAVFPTLRNDMQDKRLYGRVIDWTYAIVTGVNLGMAVVGYRMFGDSAQAQVTLNMSATDVFSRIIVLVIIVNPITKFALDLAPCAIRIECAFLHFFPMPMHGAVCGQIFYY
jgi:vesicular inhibitory amino acid transporter